MSLRSFWRRVHLWIGLGLGLLIVPIGLTGALLVLGEDLDRAIDPAFHAVTGAGTAQSPGHYVATALAAVPGSIAVRARFPTTPDDPVVVLVRGGASVAAETLQSVSLDPPTGQVLGVRDFRGTFLGVVHSFHASLLLPGFNGRAIVGWTGAGLLALALTGLYLWWPRNGGFIRGLRWSRGATTSARLHYSLGFWICVPLAIMATTGMTLSFPQQARAIVGLVAQTTPRPEPSGKPFAQPLQNIDRVASAATASLDGSRLVSLTFPTEREKLWRVQLLQGDEWRTVTIADATGAVSILPAAPPGDAFVAFLRRLHGADQHGSVWRAIALAAGLAPTLLLVTGLILWLGRGKPTTAPWALPHEKVALPAGTGQDAAA